MSPLATLEAGGKPALARALAAIEARPDAPEALALLDAAWSAPRGHAVGLTGPPGVGKSTLVDALIRTYRAEGATVAVIAVDPSSRRTGGALLGDRTRLGGNADDAGVFVRSMAARDRLGGVAALTWPALVLTRALFDIVLVETVGVGQSETEIADIADLVAFCAQPGAGDALQFMKAGVVEIPDAAIVTKADMGAPARRALADLAGALSLAAPGRSAPQTFLCSAATGEGIAAVAAALAASPPPGALEAARRRQAVQWSRRAVAEAAGVAALARFGDSLATGSGGAPFRRASEVRVALEQAIAADLS